jgi:nucleoid-associated protein YgaU
MGNDLKYGLVLGVVVLLIFVGYMAIKARGHKEMEPAVAATTASSTTAATSATSTAPFDVMAPPSDTGSSASGAGTASSVTTSTTPGIGTGTQVASNTTSAPPTVNYEIGHAPAPAVSHYTPGSAAPGGATPGTAPKPTGMTPMSVPPAGGSQTAVRPSPIGMGAGTATGTNRPGATGVTASAPRPGGGIVVPTVGTIPTVSPSAMPSQDLGTFAPKPQPISTNQKTYTIAKGDLLADIAKKEYGDASKWQQIVAANKGLDPSRLKVGQKIVLPDVASDTSGSKTVASAESASASSATESAPSGKTYTVVKGDTLSLIAGKVYKDKTQWKKIFNANKSTLSAPDKLKVGMKLAIP